MTEKTREDIIAALAAPFDPSVIQQRSGLSYVEAHVVIRRLNDATGNTWNFKVLDQKSHPFGKTGSGQDRLMLTATVELEIPGLGARQHMGVQVVNESNGGEDLWKGAVTDALKKAATLFNVGIDLYGPDREAGEVAKPPARMQQAQRDAPPRQRNVSQNTIPQRAGSPQTNANDQTAFVDQKALSAIHAVKSRRKVNDDDLHAIARLRYGVESLKDLTVAHGRDLYKLLDQEDDDALASIVYEATREPGADDEPGELTLADSFGGAPYVDLAAQYRER